VNLDKSQMSQLEEENDKLRKKVSDFQRDNIKLREVSVAYVCSSIQTHLELFRYNPLRTEKNRFITD